MNKASGAVVAVGVVVAAVGYVSTMPNRMEATSAKPLAPASQGADVDGLTGADTAVAQRSGPAEADTTIAESSSPAEAGTTIAEDSALTTTKSLLGTATDDSRAEQSTGESADFRLVTVYYGTDRAVQVARSVSWYRGPWAISGTAGLGCTAVAAWLALSGRRKWALGTGVAGIALTAGLFAATNIESGGVGGIDRPNQGGLRYGRDRGVLQVGRCEVSIPRVHDTGQLEQPSLLRLEVRARPDRHVMLQRVLPQAEAEFYQDVRQKVAASPRRDLFVFVHGYNVTFELAARRTAQMADDLDFQGAPVFYSWPSQGEPWNYAMDENNVAWTVPHLKKFLTDLASQSGAQAINLIAHSMGNRALTQAIRELAYDLRSEGRMFQQVILAAPDIDADVFQRDIAPAVAQLSSQVTLYASAHDDALAASKLVHGYRRAGDMEGGPVLVAGVNTIDVSTVDMSLLGHSYYGSSEWILRDLAALLLEGRPASERPWLKPVGRGDALYWRYETSANIATQPELPGRLR